MDDAKPMHQTCPLHGRSQLELLRLALDATRRSSTVVAGGRDAARAVEDIGVLGELIAEAGTALGAVRGELVELQRRGRLEASDGVFTDDPGAAVVSVDRWVERALDFLALARAATSKAHIASGGLADALAPTPPTPPPTQGQGRRRPRAGA